jgi:hypothetical protein
MATGMGMAVSAASASVWVWSMRAVSVLRVQQRVASSGCGRWLLGVGQVWTDEIGSGHDTIMN